MQLEKDFFSEAADSWNLEKIYRDLTQAKHINTLKKVKLTCFEKTILRGLLCGYSPNKIAAKLNWTPGALGVELTRGLYRYVETLSNREPYAIKNWRDITEWLEEAGYKTSPPIQEWEENPEDPDVTNFYGRQEELTQLEQWIVPDKYRLVILLGMAGIGKTALALKLVKNIQTEFEYIIWRNLNSVWLLSELLTNLLGVFDNNQTQKTSSPVNTNEQIAQLMYYFKQYRCLLILDSLEEILEAGNLAGFYHKKYSNYGQLIRNFVETPHQSCLMLISQEEMADMMLFMGRKVDSLKLGGLGKAAEKIFIEKALSNSNCWPKLIDRYQGNPLALKLVADTIGELFGGSVSMFLNMDTELGAFVPAFFQKLFARQFERLSNLEKQVVIALAQKNRPITMEKLQKCLFPKLDSSNLLQVLNSLRRRLLLEVISGKYQISITLQPMLLKYIGKEYRDR